MVGLKPGIELDRAIEKLNLLHKAIEDHIDWVKGTLPQIDELTEKITKLIEQLIMDRR